MAKKRKDDLIGGVKFVRLATLFDLPVAERLRHVLRENGVGAVIINDEKYQSRPTEERGKAVPPEEGFRLEVPREMAEKARGILAGFERRQDDDERSG